MTATSPVARPRASSSAPVFAAPAAVLALAPEEEAAAARACARIAPAWPLDRLIAVNPFWGMTDRPLTEVAAAVRSVSGARLLMPRAWFARAHGEGRLRDAHLEAALREARSTTTVARLRAAMAHEADVEPRARFVDVVDATRDWERQVTFRDFVASSVSQVCAAHFTGAAASADGLYATWRRHAAADLGPHLLLGCAWYAGVARQLPATADEALARAVRDLDVAPRDLEAYLWGLLLDQNGWASHCAYRRWTARLAGGDDASIVDLLAIRAAWEWMLFRQRRVRRGASPGRCLASRAAPHRRALERAGWARPRLGRLLGGRVFLHEYRADEDEDGTVLELILTAPVVVAHWINFQYYASTVDNARYGSGNKVLHDVVGEHLGVFEGNGGDLRVGLAEQSVHDGREVRHLPLRLTVVVAAPRARIDEVLARHAKVRELVEHGWLHLVQVDRLLGEAVRRSSVGWEPTPLRTP